MLKKVGLQHKMSIKTHEADKTLFLSGEKLLLSFCQAISHLSHNVSLSVSVEGVQCHLECLPVE